jgi:hypothetical protein
MEFVVDVLEYIINLTVILLGKDLMCELYSGTGLQNKTAFVLITGYGKQILHVHIYYSIQDTHGF